MNTDTFLNWCSTPADRFALPSHNQNPVTCDSDNNQNTTRTTCPSPTDPTFIHRSLSVGTTVTSPVDAERRPTCLRMKLVEVVLPSDRFSRLRLEYVPLLAWRGHNTHKLTLCSLTPTQGQPPCCNPIITSISASRALDLSSSAPSCPF